jgi:hypothetical protein
MKEKRRKIKIKKMRDPEGALSRIAPSCFFSRP